MSEVRYNVDDSIATITLNRPEARNAYTTAMADALVEAVDRADDDGQVNAVVVTGAGPAFCAGGDLKAMRDDRDMFAGDPVELRGNYLKGMQRIPRRFERFEKPTVAAINGHAIGAGLDLALMCDIRVASAAAKFGSTFARVGLIPGDGGAYLLRRVVGFSKAVELILTARVLEADEAVDIGLVTEIVDPDSVAERARQTAAHIASLPSKAVQTAKAALYQSVDQDIESALQLTAALQACVQRTDQHREAVQKMIDQISDD